MEWISAVLVVVALVGSAALLTWTRSGDGAAHLEAWLPPELRGAQLMYSERTFKSEVHRIVARLDRAYGMNGVLTLVELKTRRYAKATLSDVIELSAQRVALRDDTGARVSKVAYVAVEPPQGGTRRVIKVDLLETRKVVALRDRLELLKAGQVPEPRPTRRQEMCRSCGHRDRCSRRFGDRTELPVRATRSSQ